MTYDPLTPVAVGAAAQAVAPAAYTVGSSVSNGHLKRYAAIRVKCDKSWSLYVYGGDSAFASAGGNAPASGLLAYTTTGKAATPADGETVYVRVAGFAHVLPCVVNNDGAVNAAVTMAVQLYNE